MTPGRSGRRSPPALLLALALVSAACATVPTELTVAPEDSALGRRVARLAREGQCRYGVAALHVESGRKLFWNADEPFEAASVIKLSLLVEAAARVTAGTLDLTSRWALTNPTKAAPSSFLIEFDEGLQPTERDLLYLMIGRSDNTAANRFYDLFGPEAVNSRMASLGFPKILLQGRIPDRDPEDTQSDRWRNLELGSMTPRDTLELYRRVLAGELLGGKGDALILDVLKSQRQLDRIPRLLLEEPKSSWAGKTGTKRGVRNDSGIFTSPRGRFILVMFASDVADTPGAGPASTRAMGEMAKAIVSAWSAR